jgi:hypothetical protein
MDRHDVMIYSLREHPKRLETRTTTPADEFVGENEDDNLD